MDETSERFSAAVHTVIDATQLTQQVVASVLAVSQPTLNRKIAGIAPWKLCEVHVIGILFGIPPAVLIGNDPEKLRRRIRPRKIAERAVMMGRTRTVGAMTPGTPLAGVPGV